MSDGDASSSSSEHAIPMCSFSESEDSDGEPLRRSAEAVAPAWAGLRGPDLQAYFTGSLRDLRDVHRHNHHDRSLADLPAAALAPSPELLASKDPPIPYVDYATTSVDQFTKDFVEARRPCMITGAAVNWRASDRWSSKDIMLEHYGDVLFKVSEIYGAWQSGGKPRKVELPLRLYVEEVKATNADFPFYVFERDLDGSRQPLDDDFEPPKYFRDDLYDLTEYTRAFFPLYRYMVIGPERTGSNIHVDPSCTSAWNTLLCGLKRWCLFPPGDADEYKARIGVEGACRTAMGGRGNPPAHWWLDVLPRLKAEGAASELGMIEFVQLPGETIYVPDGWWHCVLNIGFTIAVTQNLLAAGNLANAWPTLEADWPDFAPIFARLLQERRPDVALPQAAVAAAASEKAVSGATKLMEDPMTVPSTLCAAAVNDVFF